MRFSASAVLLIIAVVLFLLSALDFKTTFNLVSIGLAAFAGSFLVQGWRR